MKILGRMNPKGEIMFSLILFLKILRREPYSHTPSGASSLLHPQTVQQGSKRTQTLTYSLTLQCSSLIHVKHADFISNVAHSLQHLYIVFRILTF